MGQQFSTVLEEDAMNMMAKRQSVCPECGYRHAGAATVCDVCASHKKRVPIADHPLFVPVPEPSPVVALSPIVYDTPMPLQTSIPGHADDLSLAPQPETPQIPEIQQKCRICAHPERVAIDHALQHGTESQRQLAKHYHLNARPISSHRLTCLALPPQTPQEAAKRGGQSTAALAGCKVCRHPSVEEIDAKIQAGIPAAAIKRAYRTSPVPISDKVIASHRRKCLHIAQGLPRGNRSGKPRGRNVITSNDNEAKGFPMDVSVEAVNATDVTPSQPSFLAQVALEIARLAQLRERLADDIAVLTSQLTHAERQYVALRAFQEIMEEN